MHPYTIEAAKADLGALLYRTSNGEEVVITEEDKPVARLIPITDAQELHALPGLLVGMKHHLTKEEADDFAHDIEEARRILNTGSIRDPWAS